MKGSCPNRPSAVEGSRDAKTAVVNILVLVIRPGLGSLSAPFLFPSLLISLACISHRWWALPGALKLPLHSQG